MVERPNEKKHWSGFLTIAQEVLRRSDWVALKNLHFLGPKIALCQTASGIIDLNINKKIFMRYFFIFHFLSFFDCRLVKIPYLHFRSTLMCSTYYVFEGLIIAIKRKWEIFRWWFIPQSKIKLMARYSALNVKVTWKFYIICYPFQCTFSKYDIIVYNS